MCLSIQVKQRPTVFVGSGDWLNTFNQTQTHKKASVSKSTNHSSSNPLMVYKGWKAAICTIVESCVCVFGLMTHNSASAFTTSLTVTWGWGWNRPIDGEEDWSLSQRIFGEQQQFIFKDIRPIKKCKYYVRKEILNMPSTSKDHCIITKLKNLENRSKCDKLIQKQLAGFAYVWLMFIAGCSWQADSCLYEPHFPWPQGVQQCNMNCRQMLQCHIWGKVDRSKNLILNQIYELNDLCVLLTKLC